MKKILFILPFIVLSFKISYGQQMPQFTQYSLNEFVINPAVAGTEDFFNSRVINRYQWLGVTDAPRTYTMSLYGPHKKLPMGYGGYIFSDITGPTRRSGIYLSYAYNIKLVDDIKMSMGLSTGLLQFKIDATKITFKDETDLIKDNLYVDYIPDASFGIHIYSPDYYFGVSSSQLLSNRIVFADIQDNSLRRLANHIFIYGGYKYKINETFVFEPSLLVKKVKPSPLQLDINAKVTYQNTVWASLGYRTAFGPNIILGYNMHDQLYFGYSYDFPFSNLGKLSTGSHEFMLGARFNKVKKAEPISTPE